ncbi:large neutral amino acids transporter small subunit 1-like [Octopus vulgaris]|uniref:Large neutral amino acids transporter small subunit 1-like n=2 Tax=Octopus TaxID=6643 RepID=A0AA36BI82_OCTVU|nr:large neutral amino acids transporter small subunit 1 [Octopus sinensis]CAI9734853.1 large neutral amino acids transporter small subunit 1-like [Octopus vulgaris]
MARDAKVELKKQVTLLQGVGIIVGIIIGSGIFVSPVGILQNVKSVGLSLLMWAICGLYNMLCALCYAELGASIPESGGEYIYIKRAFGDFAGFVCLWINFLLVCPVGIAAASLIFTTYLLKPIFSDCDIPESGLRLISALVVMLLIMLNCINVKLVTRLQLIITFSKIIALLIIIVIGFYWIGTGNNENLKNTFTGTDYRIGPIALSFYSGFWAYSGWSYLNFLTGELVNPNRNLPLAILISMSLVITVYLIANVAYLGVLSPFEMLKSTAVAVTFAEQTLGPASWVMPILIAISVIGMINGTSLSMSRLFFVGAQNNHMPKIISMITRKNLTPAPSLLIILLLSLSYQQSGDIFFLIEMEGFGFATVLVMVFAGQVYLRRKEPKLLRPIKVPVALPIILFFVSLIIVALTFYEKPYESLFATGVVAVGCLIYLFCVRWKNKPLKMRTILYKITCVLQKTLDVVEVDVDEELNWD